MGGLHLLDDFDKWSATPLILLDLSAAFNTIAHGSLPDNLSGLGLEGDNSVVVPILPERWVSEWGSGGLLFSPLATGVSEDSILSLMALNIYMKPLSEVNRMYVNDNQIYLALSADIGKVSPILDGVAQPLKEDVHSLGVRLLLDRQVAAKVRSAFYPFQLVSQLQPFMGRKDPAAVVNTLVTSRLKLVLTFEALYDSAPTQLKDCLIPPNHYSHFWSLPASGAPTF